jgi:hypothetical protein
MNIASATCSRVLLAVAVLALGACASTDFQYAQLVGERYFRAPIDTYPVLIVRVDDKDTILRPVLVDPGVRRVTVQGPPGGAGGPGEQREITLTVAPCTRYYLVAVRPNRLASDFDVRVDYQEPVGGCKPPAAS